MIDNHTSLHFAFMNLLFVDYRMLCCVIWVSFLATIKQKSHLVFLHTSWGQFLSRQILYIYLHVLGILYVIKTGRFFWNRSIFNQVTGNKVDRLVCPMYLCTKPVERWTTTEMWHMAGISCCNRFTLRWDAYRPRLHGPQTVTDTMLV